MISRSTAKGAEHAKKVVYKTFALFANAAVKEFLISNLREK